MKVLSGTLFLILVIAAVPRDGLAQPAASYKINLQTDVRVPMRDGVTLSADIYRPVGTEKFPVLLERTPYNRAGESAMANELASGSARFLTDGIVRARYRDGTCKPSGVIPGKVHKYSIDLWATGNVFKAGHRIGLYISSSNFPRFNRNLNTGQPVLGSSASVIAHQTIYHEGQYSSLLTLPIIPANRQKRKQRNPNS
jgi:predicted acyl esterase